MAPEAYWYALEFVELLVVFLLVETCWPCSRNGISGGVGAGEWGRTTNY